MKLYIITFMLTFFVATLGVGIFNYRVDSANIYNEMEIEGFIAGQMVKGKNVNINMVISEHLLYREVVDLLNQAPEIIAIGSSRVSSLSSDDVGCESFFNHWVNAANLEDYYAILGIYEKRMGLPGKIILSIDPSLFNLNKEESRWRDLLDEANYMFDLVGNKNVTPNTDHFRKIKAMFSLHYAAENYTYNTDWVRNADLSEVKVIDDEATPSEGYIIKRDGSVKYRFEDQVGNTPDYDQKLIRQINDNGIYALESYDTIDAKTWNAFIELIEYLLNEGVEVFILLPPYYPVTYDRIAEDSKYKNILEVEMMFKKIDGVVVVGSYDPSIDGYIKDDYLDDLHLKSLIKNLGQYEGHCN